MEVLNFITQHYAVISLIVYILSGYIIYKLSANFVTRKEYEGTTAILEEHEKTLIDVAQKLNAIETKLESLPDKGTIHELLLGIQELRGQQKSLEKVVVVQIEAQTDAIKRLEKQVDMLVTGHLGEMK